MQQTTMEELTKAADFINDKLGLKELPKPKAAIVLGSGLSQFAEGLKEQKAISFNEIPYFCSSTVAGHKGELIIGFIKPNYPVLVMSGRLHLYEGCEAQQVAFPIRVLGLLGISVLIITNASGAIGDNFEPGQLMVITDHINLTGSSPLVGKNIEALGPRFVDMSEAYDKKLIKIAKAAAVSADIKMHEGVYAGLLGPCYETPAEILMLKKLGADAVGMSTVFETIAARHMGIRVLAICSLTNKAAGLSLHKISHEEVMENNKKVASKLTMVLTEILTSSLA